jgi:GNAT superfamily N-acetyltransferase
METLIRTYRPADFDAVTMLWRLSREISLPEFERTKGHSLPEDRAFFRDVILTENQVWVAEMQGTPAAFMAMREDFIDRLYVDPDRWRRGIGTALIAHARSLSPGHLWLYTLQINSSARAFYEKHGFVAEKFGISPPPESEPDVEYHWRHTA